MPHNDPRTTERGAILRKRREQQRADRIAAGAARRQRTQRGPVAVPSTLAKWFGR